MDYMDYQKKIDYQKNFQESTGLVIQKIAFFAWFFLPLLIWIVTSILSLFLPDPQPPEPYPVEIVNDACYTETYYESLNETTCSLEITFNQNVYEGTVTVAFYDEKDRHLGNWDIPLSNAEYYPEYGTKMQNTYFDIDGKVDSYEIIDYSGIRSAEEDLYWESIESEADDTAYEFVLWAFGRFIFVFPFTLGALFLSCKRFRIGEHYAVVYAGWTHHYLKIDGIKMDEKVELFSFTGIMLTGSTAEGDQLEVYISRSTNHISLRCNGILQNPID